MRLRFLPVLLLTALLAQGCALIPDTVPINYSSTTATVPMLGASQVTVAVVTNDARPGNPRQFSVKKNGYGMEMASILADRPVADIVQDALSLELRKAGFQVGAGRVTVAAEVNRFTNDYKVGFFSASAAAEVTLAVQVRDASGRIAYTRTLSADGTEDVALLMGGNNAKLAVERALSATLAKLMSDQAFTQALLSANGAGGRPLS